MFSVINSKLVVLNVEFTDAVMKKKLNDYQSAKFLLKKESAWFFETIRICR